MKKTNDLRFPASYAALSEDERRGTIGGGALKDAWTEFTDNLRMDDFFFNGGLISFSFTFIPTLLFRVAVAAYDFADGIYDNIANWFGKRDDTLDALQNYTDEMRQKHQTTSV